MTGMRAIMKIGAVAMAVVCLGCAQQTESPAKLRVMGEGVAAETQTGDEVIGSEVRRRLNGVDPTGLAGVRVEVDAAVVTLSGTAPDLATAWRAEAAARAVKGVEQVHNRIVVGR